MVTTFGRASAAVTQWLREANREGNKPSGPNALMVPDRLDGHSGIGFTNDYIHMSELT
jgi:hypothetical protein